VGQGWFRPLFRSLAKLLGSVNSSDAPDPQMFIPVTQKESPAPREIICSTPPGLSASGRRQHNQRGTRSLRRTGHGYQQHEHTRAGRGLLPAPTALPSAAAYGFSHRPAVGCTGSWARLPPTRSRAARLSKSLPTRFIPAPCITATIRR